MINVLITYKAAVKIVLQKVQFELLQFKERRKQ